MRNLVINVNVTVKDSFNETELKDEFLYMLALQSKGGFQLNDIRINEISDSVLEQIPPLAPEHLGWQAPDRSEILAIDKDYAMMTEETFNKLPDYTHSSPTGKYNGKMWKAKAKEGIWMLCWCSHENLKFNFIDTNYRQILIFK